MRLQRILSLLGINKLMPHIFNSLKSFDDTKDQRRNTYYKEREKLIASSSSRPEKLRGNLQRLWEEKQKSQ